MFDRLQLSLHNKTESHVMCYSSHSRDTLNLHSRKWRSPYLMTMFLTVTDPAEIFRLPCTVVYPLVPLKLPSNPPLRLTFAGRLKTGDSVRSTARMLISSPSAAVA